MNVADIEAEIDDYDGKARHRLGLNDDDDWREFTSPTEHPELFAGRMLLDQRLARARATTPITAPVPRGSKSN